jgi:hypothetical protein
MAAPTNAANKPEESSCQLGAVHTWHFCDMRRCLCDVRFSNRPFGVKHFQAIHHSGVNVARGLSLLFGLGTKALVWGFLCQGICQGRASFSFVGFLI